MENTGRIIAVEILNGRYSVTVMSFEARFITVCASTEVRTLFERLGISHDCRAPHSCNSRRIQIPACRLYTFARIVEQRKEKKGGRIPMSFA